MEKITLYHNHKCGSSRGALELLRSKGAAFEIVEYLKDPPNRATLERLLKLRGGDPADFLRTKDPKFAAAGLDPGATWDSKKVVEALLVHPEVMQRPVAVRGDRVVIARPPEKVLELL